MPDKCDALTETWKVACSFVDAGTEVTDTVGSISSICTVVVFVPVELSAAVAVADIVAFTLAPFVVCAVNVA